jgi:hypothetical protein
MADGSERGGGDNERPPRCAGASYYEDRAAAIRGIELALAALEILCRCARGRAAAVGIGGRAQLLPILARCVGGGPTSSVVSVSTTKLSIRILSQILLKPPPPPNSSSSSSSPSNVDSGAATDAEDSDVADHAAAVLASVELGVFSRAMHAASRFPASSRTRHAALRIAKSLSHFVPSFL